jgi:hypothetical protein
VPLIGTGLLPFEQCDSVTSCCIFIVPCLVEANVLPSRTVFVYDVCGKPPRPCTPYDERVLVERHLLRWSRHSVARVMAISSFPARSPLYVRTLPTHPDHLTVPKVERLVGSLPRRQTTPRIQSQIRTYIHKVTYNSFCCVGVFGFRLCWVCLVLVCFVFAGF